MLATLLQQWARRYLRVAYPHYNSYKKARIRAFYRHGVEKLRIPWMIEALPALLHVSLFLFFAGLSVFLFGVDFTIFKVVTSWIALCVILYAWLTLLPVIRKDSPYSAPLSTSVSFCLTGLRHLFARHLQKSTTHFFSHSMKETAEHFALKQPPDIVHRSLLWTFNSLDEDTDLAKFFEALFRLCDSKTGEALNMQEGFVKPHEKELSSALTELMNRTLSSNLVTEPEKQHRIAICTKVVKLTSLLETSWILRRVLFGDWYQFIGSSEFGLFVQNWNITDRITYFYAKCVVALTVSFAQRDNHWFQLASGLLNVPKPLLNKYIAEGDNIRLASAIFVVRRTIQTYSGSGERHGMDILDASSRTLEMVCRLDIGGTLPELQHQFCGLWNKVVNTAQTNRFSHNVLVSTRTLKNIRHLFLALHKNADTRRHTAFYTTTDDLDLVLDNPMSYPMCEAPEHHSLVPNLEFDEPAPDAAGNSPITPNVPMPGPFAPDRPLHFPTPTQQAPYMSFPVVTHHNRSS